MHTRTKTITNLPRGRQSALQSLLDLTMTFGLASSVLFGWSAFFESEGSQRVPRFAELHAPLQTPDLPGAEMVAWVPATRPG